MENIKKEYIPIGHASRQNYKIIVDFIKRNKLKLIIGISSISLISLYSVLILNFINLIKLL